MNGVPPGAVTLTFTGEGVSASLTLNNVDPCTGIRNGVRVEVKGTRASDGTFTAARVELDD